MNTYKIELLDKDLNKTDITDSCSLPIKPTFTIDDTLDLATLITPYIEADTYTGYDFSQALPTSTKVEITINDINHKFIVSDSEVETISFDGEYSHLITLIEPTKDLERDICTDFSITQPQGISQVVTSSHEKTESTPVNFTDTYQQVNYTEINPSNDLSRIDGLILKRDNEVYNIYYDFLLVNTDASNTITISIDTRVGGVSIDEEVITNFVQGQGIEYINTSKRIQHTTTAKNQTVSIHIKYTLIDGTNPQVQYNTSSLGISNVFNIEGETLYFDDAVDKALNSIETRDIKDTTYTPKYYLSDETRSKLSNIIVPEELIVKNTLWDTLYGFGEILKAIPRLSRVNWGEIEYEFIDELNKDIITLDATSETQRLNMNESCDSLEINADNVVETINIINSKIEPYKGGWMSTRAEQDGPEEITEDNACFKTRQNIYIGKELFVKGIQVNYTVDSGDDPLLDTNTVYDLSERWFEKKKWDALEDISFNSKQERLDGETGKGDTLYYVTNSNRILDLSYIGRKTNALASQDAALYEAVMSVAQKENPNITVTGYNAVTNFQGVLARVNYVPFTSVRARVFKSNAREYDYSNTLFSNESARIVDSDNLSEFNQTLVNRLGKPTRVLKGESFSYNDIPRVGNLIGDETVTKISIDSDGEIDTYVAYLHKDYTGISQFVGVDSRYRQYQIPTDEIVTKNDIYMENITVSRTPLSQAPIEAINTYSSMRIQGMRTLIYNFINPSTATKIKGQSTYARVRSRFDFVEYPSTEWDNYIFEADSDNPVEVIALGTSLQINLETKDNFSVDNTKFEQSGKYFQDDYTYCNVLGNTDSFNIRVYAEGFQDNDITDADLYPEYSSVAPTGLLIETDIRADKGARDKYKYTHQINFFSRLDTTENVRVYNGISKFNAFSVDSDDINVTPVLLKNGYFPNVNTNLVDETKVKITSYSDPGVTPNVDTQEAQVNYKIVIPQTTIEETYWGWGLIENDTKQLIFCTLTDSTFTSSITSSSVLDDWLYYYTDITKGK